VAAWHTTLSAPVMIVLLIRLAPAEAAQPDVWQ
jgi:hypothetical protein